MVGFFFDDFFIVVVFFLIIFFVGREGLCGFFCFLFFLGGGGSGGLTGLTSPYVFVENKQLHNRSSALSLQCILLDNHAVLRRFRIGA